MKIKTYILFLFFALFNLSVVHAEEWDIVKAKGKGSITVFYYNSDNFISDASGKLKGIEYDIFLAFKEHLRKNGVDITINFKKSDSFSGLYEEIKYGGNGEFGACSFSMTEQRMKEVLFSPKYMPDIEVLINSDNVSIAKSEEEFIEIFSKLTALSVPNTTFEDDLVRLTNVVPGFKIQGVKTASIIRERISSEPNLFGYIELPTYLKLFQEGVRFKRQNLFKVERNGYGIILPKNSTWIKPINAFFNSDDFKTKVNQIIKKHLGEEVNDLLWKIEGSEKGLDQQEITLLTMERETQEMEIKQQALKVQILVGGVVVVLIIVFLLFYGYRMKRSVNKSLTERNLMIERQKADIESQKEVIELKNKDITDSIQYARMIQEAILPSREFFKSFLPNSFVMFRPKDVLSGDFYWVSDAVTNKDEQFLLAAVADCTGHGVPGALMSIIGNNYLRLCEREPSVNNPGEALDFTNRGISKTLRQEFAENTIKDGMDISFIALDYLNMKLYFAGAKTIMYVISEKELNQYKGDKHPVGAFVGEELIPFTNNEISVKKGDIIYLFSDGYADQFGGVSGKKFMYKRFRELLLSISHLEMDKQKENLEYAFDEWRGDLEQLDDVCVMGIKV